ncbi:hypothetical protein CGZ69_18110 [Streptomyces peucetius subsp. caesius ATCC 27952]|nr:hypothetical protein CGZ69_18110 [Streptomyces peucetius subsp. caesius ATCC 27952]
MTRVTAGTRLLLILFWDPADPMDPARGLLAALDTAGPSSRRTVPVKSPGMGGTTRQVLARYAQGHGRAAKG